jgi:hypothetical protein
MIIAIQNKPINLRASNIALTCTARSVAQKKNVSAVNLHQ